MEFTNEKLNQNQANVELVKHCISLILFICTNFLAIFPRICDKCDKAHKKGGNFAGKVNFEFFI